MTSGAWPADDRPEVAQYKAILTRLNENRYEAVVESVSPDVVYRIPGHSPLAGDYRGVEELRALLAKVAALTEGTVRLDPQVIAVEDSVVMVFATATGERAGIRLDTEICYLYRFADGRLVEGRTMPVDLYAFDAFFSA